VPESLHHSTVPPRQALPVPAAGAAPGTVVGASGSATALGSMTAVGSPKVVAMGSAGAATVVGGAIGLPNSSTYVTRWMVLDQRGRRRGRIGLLRLQRVGVDRGERGDRGEEARRGQPGGEDASRRGGVTTTVAEQSNTGVAVDG
jgi:hypothetical protein